MPDDERFYSFDEWLRFSEEQRQLLMYQALSKVNGMEKRFATKWTERAIIAMFTFILIGFLTSLVNIVFAK